MNLATLLIPLLVLAAAATPRVLPATRDAPTRYRDRGPDGLAAFLSDKAQALARGDAAALQALDAICAQHACRRAPLYWETDLETAKARARKERKPILSLHLLGRLDEPLSCANSRFFRALLYPDPRVLPLLKEGFVLHWHSVRPVPRVRIDFGEGRVMERTLTGNSAHYILDESGRPLEVLPGLWAPEAFAGALERTLALHGTLEGLGGKERIARIEAWHQARLSAVVAAWSAELDGGSQVPAVPRGVPAQVALNLLALGTREQDWEQLAARRHEGLLRAAPAAFPDAFTAGRIAVTKAVLEDPVLGALRDLTPAVAQDSVRNEFLHHGRVHAWLGHQGAAALDLSELNRKVYAELFLSPVDDPWHGLRPHRAFEAID
jgi:hypothetical protein